MGSIAWYRWFFDVDYFMLLGNQQNKAAVDSSGRGIELETEYERAAREADEFRERAEPPKLVAVGDTDE